MPADVRELLERAAAAPRRAPDVAAAWARGRRARRLRLAATGAGALAFLAVAVGAAVALWPVDDTTVTTNADDPTVTSRADPEITTYRSDEHAFSVEIPLGWQPAREPLNTWVTDPREILALATYPLRRGATYDTDCDGQIPNPARSDLGRSDAFIWLVEANNEARARGGFPPRPRHFGPIGALGEPACAPMPQLGAEHWITFQDAGRFFYVYVAFGTDASNETIRQAWQLLDSLRFNSTAPG